MKIRSHLSVMAAAILVPVVIFSALALGLLWQAQRSAALHGLQESARATLQNVDKEIGSASAALRVLGSSPTLEAGDFRIFYEQLLAADPGENAWVVLLDMEGHQILSSAVAYGEALPRSVTRGPLQEILRSQGPFVSNLFIGQRTGQYISTVNLPVELRNGKRYVLVQAFDPTYFKRVFEKSNLPQRWAVRILDRDGRLVAHNSDVPGAIGRLAEKTLIDAARSAAQGDLRRHDGNGADVYTSFIRSPVSGWTISVSAPMSEVDGSARRAVMLAAFGLAAAVAIAAFMAALVGRRLTRSIATASRSAHALAKGEPFAVPPSGIAELDALHGAHQEAARILVQARHLRSAARSEREGLIRAEQIARKRAEDDLVAKDNFMAMLGHELRNPLNAMTGAIGVLEQARATPQALASAQRILRRQTRQLAHIVDDLLDFNRMALGKIKLATTTVDLHHAVVLGIDAARAAGAAQCLTLTADDAPMPVNADPTRLEQIISNLLSNAIKFSPAHSTIGVTLSTHDGQARLVIQDSGIGMSALLLPQIFEPFVQGPVSLDRARSGLGIGLALVRQLVELHGGSITASSDGAGCGSVFTLCLPLLAVVAAEQTDPVAQAAFHVLPASSTSDMRAVGALPGQLAQAAPGSYWKPVVLLIEDNRDSREMIATLLSMVGYKVLEAENGTDGLALMQSGSPHVAIVDIGLPDMDGYAVAAAVRERELATDTTGPLGLIALTGYGQADDRRRALAAGFDMHLVKPLDIDRLIAAIDACARRPASETS